MKKLLFLLAIGLFMACNNTKAQTTPNEFSLTYVPATVSGTGASVSNNILTFASANAATAVWKTMIPSSGSLTLTCTVTTASALTASAGSLLLYVSLDGVNYFPAPLSADNTTAFGTITTVATLTSAGAGAFNYTKVWTFSPSGSVAVIGGSPNPFKYYMVKYNGVTLASAGTVSCRALIRRIGAY